MDKPWSDYKLGTKAFSSGGGYWVKNRAGWKWCTGSTFPTPGGDVCRVKEPELCKECAHLDVDFESFNESCQFSDELKLCDKFHHFNWLEEDMAEVVS